MHGHADDSASETLIRRLVALGPLRVWSVIITVFGDYARHPHATLAAQDMREILLHLGIKGDAFRVAIHRLKNDGWITSARRGRTSEYGLTETGHAQCEQARPRIYAGAPAEHGRICLFVAPPHTAVSRGTEPPYNAGGLARIGENLFLGPCAEDLEDGLRAPLAAAVVPAWLRTRLTDAAALEGYAALAPVLHDLAEYLETHEIPPGSTASALRILVIHRWRQLLLRHADLPERFFSTGWQGETCRALVQRCLARLPKLEARVSA